MNVGIGNVKGKSGGAIPTITIALSQMTSQTTAQLTDEQFEIVEKNNFINFVDPNGNKYSMSLYQDSEIHNILVFSSGLLNDTIDLVYFQVVVTKASKEARFIGINIPKPKQLYQHNISLKNGSYDEIQFTIINDSDSKINTTTALESAFDTIGTEVQCNGASRDTNKCWIYYKIIYSTNTKKKYYVNVVNQSFGNASLSLNSWVITDSVKPL